MKQMTHEVTFEEAIVASLKEGGGYIATPAADFCAELALDKTQVIGFLRESQPDAWEKLLAIHGSGIESKLLQRLVRELDLRGTLDVLRHGIVDYGVRFKMAFFRPVSALNPETQALYDQNRLTVTRQVYYSKKNRNSIDLVLGLNGLPVATVELKHQLAGQNVFNAMEQYKTSRDPQELIFQFKKRALVHFCVDADNVFMTTRLKGEKTKFLPFNRGSGNGAGNPLNIEGYKTAYLWQEVWSRDSWMDIIERFIHIQTEKFHSKQTGKTAKNDTLIFPRFHQLDAVRTLSSHARDHGCGVNYLIQHSAGSGKSNTIAWLAYRLSSLHDRDDERVFDTVIVITDRRVLDRQLQDTIYQFEHKQGVVQKIDRDSGQLASALKERKNIIITTLQKFPIIIDKMADLPDRRYALIVDEAHSSQGGEASRKMKEILAATSLDEAAEIDGQAEEGSEDNILRTLEARGPQKNLSFFAFTATPKAKTLEVFGIRGEDGKPRPFHLYSMRQAIEEGFILDVLRHYTTYETYFKLSKAIEDDPKLDKRKAARAIARFVSLHPHNLAQKTAVMVEHFRQITQSKIGGKAKAILVTSSRLHAKRYFDEFNRYIEENGYEKEIKVLVAFSGKVKDDNCPDGVSEPELNKFGEKELPSKFDTDEYKILLVAEKYQTGYDQPLLHTMFVDKRLSGVKAVQTLSRLNRIHPGKEDTFVLDFVNSHDDIMAAFQPYYELTTVEGSTDPNHLYDLKQRLDGYQVYWQSEIDQFAKIYFSCIKLNPKLQGQLHAILDPAIDRYQDLAEEEQDEFKKSLRTWTNVYAYLSQIVPFQDPELEKFFAYGRMLQRKLPQKDPAERLRLTDEVALEYYRLQKIAEAGIPLDREGEVGLPNITEAGMSRLGKEDRAPLSEIIDILNERFGTEFTEADKLFFRQIEEELLNDPTLSLQARNNSIDNFKYGFMEAFETKLLDRMEQNREIFERMFDDREFGDIVKDWMLQKVFATFNKSSK